jgi:uncharacterized protein YbaP (TraB family)
VLLRGLRGLAIVATLFALSACSTRGPLHTIETDNAFLWEAQPPPGEGAGLVLLGSLHANDGPLALGPTLEARWQDTEILVVELDVDTLDPLTTARVLFARGRLGEGTLPQLVAPETWAALVAFCDTRDIPTAIFEPFKPWFAAITVEEQRLREAGLDPENGVETVLVSRARREGRSVEALETLDEQFAAFDELDYAVQEQHLLDALNLDPVEGILEFAELWRAGDRAGLETTLFSDERTLMAPLYEALFARRNQRMAERIAELVLDGRRRFVVVGAGHTVGADSLPDLLAGRGWSVSPDSGPEP